MSSVIDNHPAVPTPRRPEGPIVQVIPEFTPDRHRPAPRRTPTANTTGSSATRPAEPARTAPPAQVQAVLRLILEVVTGRRPSTQLTGLITRSVHRYVIAEINRPDGRRTIRHRPSAMSSGSVVSARGALRGMRLCQPADGVAEVSAVWRHQGRYRALAARFECRTGTGASPRWVCTVLRLG